MSQEKNNLLWLAVKQVNSYVYVGRTSADIYFKRAKRPSVAWWNALGYKMARRRALERMQKSRKIHHRLAYNAASYGALQTARFSRTAMFIPRDLVNIDKETIAFRLYPRLELVFWWHETHEPESVRIFWKGKRWQMDYRARE
jgi:hypothetical protein